MDELPVRKSPAFQFYPSAFLASTLPMTLKETGAYIKLLCWQWEQGDIPADTPSLCRILHCTKREFDSVWKTLRVKFVQEDGRLRNPRLEHERMKQAEYRVKQAKHGKRGAKARWATPLAPHSPPMPLESVPVSQSSTIQPEQVRDLWNQTMTAPIPQVRMLTDKRRAKLRTRLEELPDLTAWTKLFQYLNTQDWCRANGSGTHPHWTATLDWIISSETTLMKQLEKMDTPMPLREVKPTGRLAKIRAGNMALTGEVE